MHTPPAPAAVAPPGPGAGGSSATGRLAVAHEPSVGSGYVLHCRDEQQELNDCGAFQFDSVAVPRIKALARCPASKGANGKLSLGLDLDFRAKTVHLILGKSTTLTRDLAEAMVHCAEPAFDAASLAQVPHDHHQYTVFYSARFGEAPAGDRAAAAIANAAPATNDGSSAFVAWDVAQVREAPRTGAVVERLLKGAKVKVLGHDGSWYRVQYGSIQGWVFREAIGL
jgi:hypothetical protein